MPFSLLLFFFLATDDRSVAYVMLGQAFTQPADALKTEEGAVLHTMTHR